jgi:hypothetical protein
VYVTKELQVHKQTRLQQALAYLAMAVFGFSSLVLVGRANARPVEPQFIGPTVADQVVALQAIAAAQANPVDLPDAREEMAMGLRGIKQREAEIAAAEKAARIKAAKDAAKRADRGGGRTPRYGQSPNGGLACIAGKESGGNYSAVSGSGKYRGKYQYSNSTWNNYGGYPTADSAPPEVQERRAQEDWNRGSGQIRSNWPNTSRGCY